MNFKNSKISVPHRLLLNISYKINLKRVINILLYQILAYTMNGKIYKKSCKIINLKYQLQHGMTDLNYLMDHILYQKSKITLNIFKKTCDSY